MKNSILTINCSETSIKFSLYESARPLTQLFNGVMENVGTQDKELYFTATGNPQRQQVCMTEADQDDAVNFFMNWLAMQEGFDSVKATGHRMAPDEDHQNPALVTPGLLHQLKNNSTLKSVNLPAEIALIEIFTTRYPTLIHIACFESTLPDNLPPMEVITDSRPSPSFLEQYGYHGFSFEYIMEELYRLAGSKAAEGRVILVHLGRRKSLAAFKNGRSIEKGIDFTAPDDLQDDYRKQGQPMACNGSTTGVPGWFATHPSVNTTGLARTSPIRGSMQRQNTLITNEADIEGYCYETRKWIGAFAAALSGIDTVVFTGGIGEHAPDVRSEVCDGLAFLGIELHEVHNMNNEKLISAATSTVTVRVVQTNEELMIARKVADILHY